MIDTFNKLIVDHVTCMMEDLVMNSFKQNQLCFGKSKDVFHFMSDSLLIQDVLVNSG